MYLTGQIEERGAHPQVILFCFIYLSQIMLHTCSQIPRYCSLVEVHILEVLNNLHNTITFHPRWNRLEFWRRTPYFYGMFQWQWNNIKQVDELLKPAHLLEYEIKTLSETRCGPRLSCYSEFKKRIFSLNALSWRPYPSVYLRVHGISQWRYSTTSQHHLAGCCSWTDAASFPSFFVCKCEIEKSYPQCCVRTLQGKYLRCKEIRTESCHVSLTSSMWIIVS